MGEQHAVTIRHGQGGYALRCIDCQFRVDGVSTHSEIVALWELHSRVYAPDSDVTVIG